mgnify:CR=1 FL=1
MGSRWVSCGPHVGHPICLTWGTDGQITWIPHEFGRGFHMGPYGSFHVVFTWGLNGYHLGNTPETYVGVSWEISWVPTGSPFGTHTCQTLVPDGSQLVTSAGTHIGLTWAAHLGSMWACHWHPPGSQLAAHLGPIQVSLWPQMGPKWGNPAWTHIASDKMSGLSGI